MIRPIIFLPLVIITDMSYAGFQNETMDTISFSFQSIDRFSTSTTDIERVDDARSFVSEALFSESTSRLSRPLTKDELKKIIRVKEQMHTLNTLRMSFGDTPDNSAHVDVFYGYKDIEDAQITDYLAPDTFNDVTLSEYGTAIQKWFWSNRVFLQGVYKHTSRRGVIEFLPTQLEYLDAYEVNGAIRFQKNTANDMVMFFPSYVFQDIEPEVSTLPTRERRIVSFGFTYGNERPSDDFRSMFSVDGILERRLDPRGLHLYGGYVKDIESYSDVDVTKEDYFFGTSFGFGKFHLAVQPTFFIYEVDNDSSQNNSQFRMNLNLYHQTTKKISFTFPLRCDIAVEGPDDFENWKIGTEMRYYTKPDNDSNKGHQAIIWSISLRYDRQSFYNLDENLDLLNLYFKLEL